MHAPWSGSRERLASPTPTRASGHVRATLDAQENKKLRAEGKRAWQETLRRLVAYIQRRDKRVLQRKMEQQKEQQAKAKAAEERRKEEQRASAEQRRLWQQGQGRRGRHFGPARGRRWRE